MQQQTWNRPELWDSVERALDQSWLRKTHLDTHTPTWSESTMLLCDEDVGFLFSTVGYAGSFVICL